MHTLTEEQLTLIMEKVMRLVNELDEQANPYSGARNAHMVQAKLRIQKQLFDECKLEGILYCPDDRR